MSMCTCDSPSTKSAHNRAILMPNLPIMIQIHPKPRWFALIVCIQHEDKRRSWSTTLIHKPPILIPVNHGTDASQPDSNPAIRFDRYHDPCD